MERRREPKGPEALAADAAAILRAGTAAADAGRLVHRALRRDGEVLWFHPKEAYRLDAFDRVIVVGAGKAAVPMAEALEEILGERITGGVIAAPARDAGGAGLSRIEAVGAEHPYPGNGSLKAAEALRATAANAGERDLVVALISGGASSLAASPEEGLSLADLQATWRALLSAGLDIHAMNTVRKHTAALFGGKLARVASPATLVTLVLSDVPGNRLDSVGSGPTVGDPSTFAEACEVLAAAGAVSDVPTPVLTFMGEGAQGKRRETPKPGDVLFQKSFVRLVGSNEDAVVGAMTKAAELGYGEGGDFRQARAQGLAGPDARSVGKALATFALYHKELVERGYREPRPLAIVGGGEAPVKVSAASGRGGRLSEFTLSAAEVLQGKKGIVVGGMATDGLDGSWDASIVLADGDTLARAKAAGLDPAALRASNNTGAVFEAAGIVAKREATRTNVADLYLALVEP